MRDMCDAFARGDLAALADHAHWLKGAGGTAGFHHFTEPARLLETLAKQQKQGEIGPVLSELIELAGAIRLDPQKPAAADARPAVCST
jgi:HPt (histidine-containing phosphotransfer) domain-containing protein